MTASPTGGESDRLGFVPDRMVRKGCIVVRPLSGTKGFFTHVPRVPFGHPGLFKFSHFMALCRQTHSLRGLVKACGGRQPQRKQSLKMPKIQSGFAAHRKLESFTKSSENLNTDKNPFRWGEECPARIRPHPRIRPPLRPFRKARLAAISPSTPVFKGVKIGVALITAPVSMHKGGCLFPSPESRTVDARMAFQLSGHPMRRSSPPRQEDEFVIHRLIIVKIAYGIGSTQ
jgi:hypothetical protein